MGRKQTDVDRIKELEVALTEAHSLNNEMKGLFDKVADERDGLLKEVERLKVRLLSAAGDDLCRLTPEEIKAYTSGAVQIPPKEEFLSSCERFHNQISGEVGELANCLTLAQLIAENEKLQIEINDLLRYMEGR